MNKIISSFKESKLHQFFKKRKKYGPIAFFIVGFIWDSLTLGRIDRLYDIVVLCFHMTALTITLYLYNLVDNDKYKNQFKFLFIKT